MSVFAKFLDVFGRMRGCEVFAIRHGWAIRLGDEEFYWARDKSGILEYFAMEVLTAQDELVMTVNRVKRSSSHQVELFDDTGRLLGTVTQQACGSSKLYVVSDAWKKELGRLQSSFFKPLNFSIKKAGKELGRLVFPLLRWPWRKYTKFDLVWHGTKESEFKALCLGTTFLIHSTWIRKMIYTATPAQLKK